MATTLVQGGHKSFDAVEIIISHKINKILLVHE